MDPRFRYSQSPSALMPKVARQVRPVRKANRRHHRSSASSDGTVTTRQRGHRAQYWAFFTEDEAAFWHCVPHGREELQPVPAPAHGRGHRAPVTHATAACWSTSSRRVS